MLNSRHSCNFRFFNQFVHTNEYIYTSKTGHISEMWGHFFLKIYFLLSKSPACPRAKFPE